GAPSLAYVRKQPSLDPFFPLAEYAVVLMGAGARLPPLWPVGRPQRPLAADCLARVGLADAAEQPFWALSGGQKQRALIARALAVQPQLLLLDEPTAGVDPGAEAAIIDAIARLNRDEGLTVIIVSHHMRLVRGVVWPVSWVEAGAATKGTTAEMLSSERLVEAFGAGARRPL